MLEREKALYERIREAEKTGEGFYGQRSDQ
jgi:hypothetical protein